MTEQIHENYKKKTIVSFAHGIEISLEFPLIPVRPAINPGHKTQLERADEIYLFLVFLRYIRLSSKSRFSPSLFEVLE